MSDEWGKEKFPSLTQNSELTTHYFKRGAEKINYAYVAYNEARELVKGRIEAKNEDHAGELLNFSGYQLVNLKEMAVAPSLDKLSLKLSPIKPADIILFFRQMALLVESGLNIVTSLELLEEQTTHKAFKKVLGEVISDVRGGSQLSASMTKYPQIFSAITCQSLKVGEQTGGMEQILRQIADHMEKQLNASKGIKNAMTYPVIALIVAVVVVAIMVTFVLPAFNALYEGIGAKMPAITVMVLSFGNLMRAYGLYILIGAAAIVIFFVSYIKTTSGRYEWDKISLKFPIVGRINHLNELSGLSRNMSILYKAGLPLTEILPLAIQATGNKILSEALVKVRDEMLGGEGLSRPMMKYPIFLPMMVQMVKVGEETGSLDSTLMSVAQSYEAEAQDKTKAMIGMIAPVMTIVIGLIVGLMALSMMSAMYSMYSQMG
jgi:type IV pilus assembly protein PilC